MASRLPPTIQGHGAGDVAAGTLGTSTFVSLVTMASQPGESWSPCCSHVVLRRLSSQAGIIGRGPGGRYAANVASKLLAFYPCRVADHAAKPGIDGFYTSDPCGHCGRWSCDHCIHSGSGPDRYLTCCHPTSASRRLLSLDAQAFLHTSSRRSGPSNMWICGSFSPNHGGWSLRRRVLPVSASQKGCDHRFPLWTECYTSLVAVLAVRYPHKTPQLMT